MKFSKRDADALLAVSGYLEYFEYVDDDGDRPTGYWPRVGVDIGSSVENDLNGWRPSQVFADDPNPLDMPALPVPFTERDLAAFMLEGRGAQMAEFFGLWEDGPNVDRVNELPRDQVRARAALRAAFDTYRSALKLVGNEDERLHDEEQLLRQQYLMLHARVTKARGEAGAVLQRQADQLAKLKVARAQAKRKAHLVRTKASASHDAWLKRMVVVLFTVDPMENAPQQSPSAGRGGGKSAQGSRGDLLSPLIEIARAEVTDGDSAAMVWPVLTRMANEKRGPFVAATADGLKWNDASDNVKFLTLKNLRERLLRSARRRSKAR